MATEAGKKALDLVKNVAMAGQNIHNAPLSDIPSLFLGETFGQYSTITQARPSG